MRREAAGLCRAAWWRWYLEQEEVRDHSAVEQVLPDQADWASRRQGSLERLLPDQGARQWPVTQLPSEKRNTSLI